MMTRPIENMRRLLDGGSGDWIPFTLDVGAASGLSEPVLRTFREETGADDPAEFFDADVRCFSLPCRFGGVDARKFHPSVEPETTFDEWGVGHYAGGCEGTVDRMYPPLANARNVDDIEALPEPIVDVDADVSAVADYQSGGYPVFGYSGSIYEWSWWLRGMENFLMDLVADVPMAEAVIAKVCRHTTRLALASARAGIDVLCMYDDAGTQHGMQLSPELWRRHIKPAWGKVLETVRAEFPRAKFFLHSCGRIDPIVPDIVALGFDILHPIQPECMDFVDMHRNYGEQILLSATLSSQQTFPFGTPETIRQDVARLSQSIGSGHRALFMPSNVIQPETPWPNVIAFAESCRAMRSG